MLAALALVKSLLGLGALATGSGFSFERGNQLTYYEPTTNFVLLLFLAVFAAAPLARVRIPLWWWPTAVLSIATLLLAYRRSFWIAAIVALALVLVIGVGRFGRIIGLPIAAVIGLALWLALTGTVVNETQSPVSQQVLPIVKRLESLDPGRIQQNRDDRYRIDERRNVLAELERQPLPGLGPPGPVARAIPARGGVPQRAHVCPFHRPVVLLNLDIVGLLAYAAVMAAGSSPDLPSGAAGPHPSSARSD